jgi:hypothetical protein
VVVESAVWFALLVDSGRGGGSCGCGWGGGVSGKDSCKVGGQGGHEGGGRVVLIFYSINKSTF